MNFTDLEIKLNNLENAFLQMSANGVKQTETVDKSKLDIQTNATNIITAEQTITDMDLAQIQAEQSITDMDLRLIELEGKINE